MTDQRNNRGRAARAGFTLVELMVVIAIIAILASIVGFNVLGSMEEANAAQAKAQIKNFKTALIAYKLKFKKFPTTSEGLDALINNGEKSFLDAKEVPVDPWNNPYLYTNNDGVYKIVSYGADGVQGGTGENADISSESLDK